MQSSAPKVVHVSPRVQARGGIEALLALHRTQPRPQAFVALFDRGPEQREDYANLNFTWRTPLGRMRREFARALAPHAGSLVIYHNAWGLPLFHAGDGASRRFMFCHASPAYLRRELRASAGLVDGALGVTPALVPAWMNELRLAGENRGCVLPLPVAAPPGIARRAGGDGEIVLGYAGRVEREQKRLDRLPAFLRALQAAGVSARVEVLGDGSLRGKLECELAGRVRFHGWQQGEAYWKIISQWDGIVFFSEFEGSPIALNEAMSLGVIPFFPQIGGTMADVYVQQVDERCHYPAGDMAALAGSIARVWSGMEAERETLRRRARALMAPNTAENYFTAFEAFQQRIAALPRISATGEIAAPRWSDALPLGFVARAAPWLLRRR